MGLFFPRPSNRALLLDLTRKVNHIMSALDSIAADWPTLKQAITDKLAADAAKIDELTTELKATPPDDPRAAQIDGEIKALTASIKGTVADTPAPAAAAA